jgi:hypothetical protein
LGKNTNNLVDTLAEWFDKLPTLPANAREILVKIAPWIALIFGLLGVLGALGGLGLLTVFAPLSVLGGGPGMAIYGTGFVATILWAISSVLLLLAFPGTKAKRQSGWNLLFWSEVVNLIGSLAALNIVGGIVGAVIGFYLLFQIRSFYK